MSTEIARWTHMERQELKFQKYFRKMKDEVRGNNCISPYNGVNSLQIETGCMKGFVERKILHLWVENEKSYVTGNTGKFLVLRATARL